MGLQRAHIFMPADLIEEIDALVGQRGRSAFLVETARAELRRRRLLEFFERESPVMQDEDYPELAALGSSAWVKKSRGEWKARNAAPEARPATKI